ncbi:MAG: AAA family ATPase [Brevundimonas sp.]|uniref:ATP-dependent nuclease n=1 Tax=Brevundimonas sp. TaxID=1871086 RepID=UPI002AB884CE|nr:AAA family ATPase [Brevundimonas sp.]MDZ4108419.1 AAA family ATPase [Brevundimonas sp.]
MKLIRRIEISYLRSLYTAVLDRPGDMNVVFGRNDSGKSNLLRALNLFFNEETEPGRGEIDFDLDFSDIRREAAKAAKGRQFIAIRVDFSVPQNYRPSLGQTVSIKRQWNIDGDMTETLPRGLSKGSRIQLTRFLNQIDFTYIPAIKDLNVFGDLIERMYAATAESSGFETATDTFVDAIRSQTSGLSEGLSKLFGSTTRLAAPTDMGLLFRSLDFAHGDDGHSLLRQKGDGVKARHLPELLRYINENESGKKFFVWGFEEPENSLDLGAADAEAERFAVIAARSDTQVFITSHSPAFYLSNSDQTKTDIRRVFISKQRANDEGPDPVAPKNAISVIDDLTDAEARMKEASLLQLPYLIRQWGELKKERDDLEREGNSLRAKLEALTVPTVFVEGRHDKAFLEAAFARAGHTKAVINVRILDGTPATTPELLPKLLLSGALHQEAPVLFLFDNDGAGRRAHRNICGVAPPAEICTVSEKLGVWLLPQSAESVDFAEAHGIRPEQLFFTSEFLYPAKLAAELCLDVIGAEEAEASRASIHENYHKALSQSAAGPLRTAEPGSVDWFFARGVPDAVKARFAARAEKSLPQDQVDSVAAAAWKFLNP